jgi:hypothetical protein
LRVLPVLRQSSTLQGSKESGGQGAAGGAIAIHSTAAEPQGHRS